MPHIIVEYSKTVGSDIDMDQLLISLHKNLAKQGVDQARIKTRAMSISQSVVGANPPGVGLMVHTTLLLLAGRETETKKTYAEGLHGVLKSMIGAKFPDCSITLEVRDMDPNTYIP